MANKKAQSVFEKYADEYDLITNASARESYHRKEVQTLIDAFGPARVLDAGCATGLTTRLFAEAGVSAVGVDRSRPMLRTAREKCVGSKLPISFQYGDFQKLPAKLTGKFDLLACLANGISGVETLTGLRRSLKSFRSTLVPGGTFVLQMLNYTAIAEGELMPVRATENKGIVYERFSERSGNKLGIYVTRLDLNQSPPQFEVFRHQFANFSVSVMMREVRNAGFVAVKKYADLTLKKPFGRKARDLVIVARN